MWNVDGDGHIVKYCSNKFLDFKEFFLVIKLSSTRILKLQQPALDTAAVKVGVVITTFRNLTDPGNLYSDWVRGLRLDQLRVYAHCIGASFAPGRVPWGGVNFGSLCVGVTDK